MNDEPRVWTSSRRLKTGRRSYHLRWICPETDRWKNKRAGTERKHAQREAAKLETELRNGTYREIESIGWQAFVDDHVAKISGMRNATEARRTLEEFGRIVTPGYPRRVTYSRIERYIAELRSAKKPNKPATIAKKLRYLRAAFNSAIDRDYAKTNPVKPKLFPTLEVKPPRVCTDAEETALLDAAESLYGERMRGFIIAALGTGGRRGELLRLTWDRVTFGDEPEVHFTKTKSHRDRIIPIEPETADVLQRLQVQTLVQGGPFVGMADNLGRRWGRVVRKAGVSPVTMHNLRCTYITRLVRAGADLPSVQKLAGHANIQTTLRYYNWTSRDDLRRAVSKLRNRA